MSTAANVVSFWYNFHSLLSCDGSGCCLIWTRQVSVLWRYLPSEFRMLAHFEKCTNTGGYACLPRSLPDRCRQSRWVEVPRPFDREYIRMYDQSVVRDSHYDCRVADLSIYIYEMCCGRCMLMIYRLGNSETN